MNLEDLRLAVYERFAEEGQPPTAADLATQLAASPTEITAGLAQLAAARHLALNDNGAIVMAHPFSAVPWGFP